MNKIGIAIKFCKCYIIKRSPSNFLNKTQLKIKLKIEIDLGAKLKKKEFSVNKGLIARYHNSSGQIEE
jgi:hypothetical protein